MNAVDVILLLLIAAAAAMAAWSLLRQRRRGKTGCGGSCAGCTLDCAGRKKETKP